MSNVDPKTMSKMDQRKYLLISCKSSITQYQNHSFIIL